MAVPILWRNRKQRYSLEGEVCPACTRAVFPPREVCPYCSRAGLTQTMPESLSQSLPQSMQHATTASHAPTLEWPRREFVFLMPHVQEPEEHAHASLREAGDD